MVEPVWLRHTATFNVHHIALHTAEHFDSAITSTHASAAARLSKADDDWRAISAALYSHSSFQQIHLTDPKLEDAIRDTEVKLEAADGSLLTAEGSEISLDDPKVRDFVHKYSQSRK